MKRRCDLLLPLFWVSPPQSLRFAIMKTSLRIGGLALFGAGLLGCGANLQGIEKELAAMRAELVALRAKTTVLSERVSGLTREESKPAERAGDAFSSATKAPLGDAKEKNADTDRPELSVVRVMPAGALGIGFKEDGPREESLVEQEEGEDDENRTVLRSIAGGVVVAEKASDTAKKPVAPLPRWSKPAMNAQAPAQNAPNKNVGDKEIKP